VERLANLVGAQVRHSRISQGLSQADLAVRLELDHGLHIDQSDVSEIERGVRGVRDIELVAVAAVLGVTVIELLGPYNAS
jgi:transcriptional regulator with XRE-family HTH domain